MSSKRMLYDAQSIDLATINVRPLSSERCDFVNDIEEDSTDVPLSGKVRHYVLKVRGTMVPIF